MKRFKVITFVLLSGGFLQLAKADEPIIFRAEIPKVEWNGWGFASPPAPEDVPKANLPPEQFTLMDRDGSAPRVFSGKVVGPKSMKGVEVGLVSLEGIQWVNPQCYQWQSVSADGTFSITDANFPEALKAIVVRGPEIPWTFLRYNFKPWEAAKDIVLNASEGKRVRFSASGEDIKKLCDAQFEVFPAYTEFDDKNRKLRRQRLSEVHGQKDSVEAVVPLGEFSILVGSKGYAQFYQTIDTRKGDNFHFVLLPSGQMKIRVLDRAGDPQVGVSLRWKNPAAPLSYAEARTNEKGELFREDLTPGTFKVKVDGFLPQDVEVEGGKLAELELKAGVVQ